MEMEGDISWYYPGFSFMSMGFFWWGKNDCRLLRSYSRKSELGLQLFTILQTWLKVVVYGILVSYLIYSIPMVFSYVCSRINGVETKLPQLWDKMYRKPKCRIFGHSSNRSQENIFSAKCNRAKCFILGSYPGEAMLLSIPIFSPWIYKSML